MSNKNKLKTNSFFRKINPFQEKTKIQTQLLTTLLPTVLTPLLVASSISYSIISERLQNDLEKKVSNQVILARQAVNDAFLKSVSTPRIISFTPSVINLAKQASQVVEAEGLPLLSQLDTATIANIEEKYQKEKLLKLDDNLNQFLTLVQETEAIGKIIITDRNGYTIGYSETPPRFIHHQQRWWQEGKNQNSWASPVLSGESPELSTIDYVRSITDSETGDFLGIIKFEIPLSRFDVLSVYLENSGGMAQSQLIQIIDIESKKIITSASLDNALDNQSLLENEVILGVLQSIQQEDANAEEFLPEEIERLIIEKFPIKNFDIYKGFDANFFGDDLLSGYTLNASFILDKQKYHLVTIPGTSWVAIASIDLAEIESAGRELIWVFLTVAIVLGIVTTGIIILISRKISLPLINLADKAQEVADGNLEIVVQTEGSLETATVATNFNNLLTNIKSLLQQQQDSLMEVEKAKQEVERLALSEKQQKENIQKELFELLSDVEGASSGDLTVRAQITEGEIGIIADFFNSIVESLREIVTQVKDTTLKVNQSLSSNEEKMAELATSAVKQADKTQQMLDFVSEMTDSIQIVASNTQLVAKTAQKASNTASNGEIIIDKTFKSIISLRNKVGETGKKVKKLGESSQQISKAISLINQIALQTNLLAINASVEAARAGEEGRGFAVVAEEVGQLASQSAMATKEIEKIVETIQKETAEVVEAMEDGTIQVVESTNLVTKAKEGFGEITKVSQQINDLLQSISMNTVSQTQTSEIVTNLIKDVAQLSQVTSSASHQVSEALGETIANAKNLQASVETFKVS
jgi:twitching motility protein PilJ